MALRKRQGGSFQDHPNSWKKLSPCRGTPQDLQEGSRSDTDSRWSHSVISLWTYSPSIPPALLQVDTTKGLFPLKEEKFPQVFPQILLMVLPNLLSPSSQSLVSSSGDCFQCLSWPGIPRDPLGSPFTDLSQHKHSGLGVDLQDSPFFSYHVPKIWTFFSSLEMGQ